MQKGEDRAATNEAQVKKPCRGVRATEGWEPRRHLGTTQTDRGMQGLGKGSTGSFKSHHYQLEVQYNFKAGLACWVGGALLRQLPFQKPRIQPGQTGQNVFLPKSPDRVPTKTVLHSEPRRSCSLSWCQKLVGGMVRNGKGLKQESCR